MNDNFPSLRQDTRGAILLVGIFFATFLLGMVWFIVGIGDAIVYRERLLDAADATAFAGAVYHARGMNLVALINLLMAAFMSIIIALKVLQIILAAIISISCPLCIILVGCAICVPASNFETTVSDLAVSVTRVVDPIVKGLGYASTGLKHGMPYIAEAKSVYVAMVKYKDITSGGFTVSISMIPGFGLPVENDDPSVLCGQAGRFLADLILAPLNLLSFLKPITNFFSSIFQSIIAAGSGFFCGTIPDPGKVIAQGSQSLIDQMINECGDRRDAIAAKPKRSHTAHDKNFNHDDCINQAKGSNLPSSGVSENRGPSKRVLSKIKDGGSAYFAILAVTWAPPLVQQNTVKKALKIAAWNRATIDAPSAMGRMQFSQADFYYDITGHNRTWSSYKAEVMWNMRWRARLRRIHLPPFSSVDGLSNLLKAALTSLYLMYYNDSNFGDEIVNVLFYNKKMDIYH
ncbi:hypothetical protein [Pajaroellobacter abortibovis]|uniref:Uncharacterized protein n=1 Tax=Pajaroellobacter abortibovis TaxID=1882918 RepID=A0A1L6MYA1_9BACT|nr:hypothetical protein [Pajaroellobacter abortibovis]APS00524.1 hypothetical protein BCY86_07430 [Pajaroellobacter abortibovis]